MKRKVKTELLKKIDVLWEMLIEANQHTHNIYGERWFDDLVQCFEERRYKNEKKKEKTIQS